MPARLDGKPPTLRKKGRSRRSKQLKAQLDRLFQEWGRKTYDNCLLCGGTYCCLHHYIHRAQSLALRWDQHNGVPVCNKCHCRIHSKNNPLDILDMTNKMSRLFGGIIETDHVTYPDWKTYIVERKNTTFKPTMEDLLTLVEMYKNIL